MCFVAESGKAGSGKEGSSELDEAALVQKRGKLNAQLKASHAAVSNLPWFSDYRLHNPTAESQVQLSMPLLSPIQAKEAYAGALKLCQPASDV